jgi:hypothetical protein
MGLWYLSPPGDSFFISEKKAASSKELQNILKYLEGLCASGFHVSRHIRAIKKELNERLDSRGNERV